MEKNNCNATPTGELIKKREKVKFKFKTKFTSGDTESYKDWFSFYPEKSYFKFRLDSWGYFDPRPQIGSNLTSILVLAVLTCSLLTLSMTWFHLAIIPFLFFGWGDFYITLPFDTGKTDESDNPSYGFYMYHIDPAPGKINFPSCFIWQWGDYKSWDMPWARTWVRTSILLEDGNWEHETKGNRKQFYEDEWKSRQYVFTYNFLDRYDKTIVPAKVYVEEREWRQHWLKWTSLFAYVNRTIDVHFSKEVGSRKGSWKGGTMGCGYTIRKGETAIECMQRMEKERTFR